MIYNKALINILEQVSTIKSKQGAVFPARAYDKAKEFIILNNSPIKSMDDLMDKPQIGKSALNVLKEYMETGTVTMIEKAKKDPMYVLSNIFGIGPKKSRDLVKNHHINSIAELRQREDLLNTNQKLGLKYYEDIMKRIPREEIVRYERELTTAFNMLHTNTATFQIVGSYRRGAKDSGDIDIIITDTNKSSTVFHDFLDLLIERNLLVEVLTRGNVKSLGISQLRRKPARRIDFMFTPKEEYAFAVLYFTGSKAFNTIMRARALKLGYSMNEHGLYEMVGKKKGPKLNQYFPDEESIFKFLGMVYKEPHERIDCNSAEYINTSSNKLTTHNKTLKNKKIPKNKTLKKSTTFNCSSKMYNAESMVNEYKQKGETFLKKLNEDQLSYFIRLLNKYYYGNNKPLVDDEQYDILKEYIEEFYPNNEAVKEGHTKCTVAMEKNKVELPYTLWSMDKIKTESGVKNKLKKYKNDKVITVKVDGISAMYYKGKLFTRGNGTHGQDISWLLKYIKLPNRMSDVVRGELLIKKDVFNKKYKGLFCNMRNLVAGIANAKNIIEEQARDIDFVAYEVIEPGNLSPLKQMEYLNKHEYNHVEYLHKKNNKVNVDLLSKILLHWRENYLYDNDGIIITDNKCYPRVNGNPEHAFAFKMVLSDQIVETMVTEVQWSPSKDGYLKPKLKVQPVVIGGATIQYVTAHNAAFVRDKKIGIGTKIQIIRSGDVIPKVHKVVKCSSEPLMPSADEYDFSWNKSGIDLILNDMDTNEVVMMKRISEFFKNLEVDGLGRGNVQRIMNAGFDSVHKIIRMTKKDFMTVEGFKEKMTNKVYNSIHSKLREMSLIKLMTATNVFGRGMGYNRLKLIMETYPDILMNNETEEAKYEKILVLPGFKQKTSQAFVPYIGTFVEFLKDCKMLNKIKEYQESLHQNTNIEGTLTNTNIVITGFRDKKIIEKIQQQGGKLLNSVNKNTHMVVVKDITNESTKILKAKKMGIPIMDLKTFQEQYAI
jgi:DNA ligase (NAD+)